MCSSGSLKSCIVIFFIYCDFSYAVMDDLRTLGRRPQQVFVELVIGNDAGFPT
jgi:hypothetical protein